MTNSHANAVKSKSAKVPFGAAASLGVGLKSEPGSIPKPPELDSNRRAVGRRFSCAVPEGWGIAKGWEGRSFALAAGDPMPDDDLTQTDYVAYSSMTGDNMGETLEMMQSSGMPELNLTLALHTACSVSGPFAPQVLEFHEVQGINCTCLVMQIRAFAGLEFRIKPYAIDHSDVLRVVLFQQTDETLASARAFVDAIAASIELDHSLQPQCLQELDRCQRERVSAEEFQLMVTAICSPLILSGGQMLFNAGTQLYRTANPGRDAASAVVAGVELLAKLNERSVTYFDKILDAYKYQRDTYGASQDDLNAMFEKIDLFNQSVFTRSANFNDAEGPLKQRIEELLRPSEAMLAICDRMESLRPDGSVKPMPALRSIPESEQKAPVPKNARSEQKDTSLKVDGNEAKEADKPKTITGKKLQKRQMRPLDIAEEAKKTIADLDEDAEFDARWLMDNVDQVETTLKALSIINTLIEQGFVEKRGFRAGRMVYRMAPSQRVFDLQTPQGKLAALRAQQERVDLIDKQIDELQTVINIAKQREADYSHVVNMREQLLAEIEEKRLEFEQTGLFHFGKKRDLDNEIAEMTERAKQLEQEAAAYHQQWEDANLKLKLSGLNSLEIDRQKVVQRIVELERELSETEG